MDKNIVTIPYKFPSLNDYVDVCRSDRYKAARLKKDIQRDISYFVKRLPRYDCPVKIHFHWIEGNKKRDYDNIAFAKKFMLDAMVQYGILKDDNRKCVVAFTDTFEHSDKFSVMIEVERLDNGTEEENN